MSLRAVGRLLLIVFIILCITAPFWLKPRVRVAINITPATAAWQLQKLASTAPFAAAINWRIQPGDANTFEQNRYLTEKLDGRFVLTQGPHENEQTGTELSLPDSEVQLIDGLYIIDDRYRVQRGPPRQNIVPLELVPIAKTLTGG